MKTTQLWDGANMAAELTGTSTVQAVYVRGIGLLRSGTGASQKYYLYNAHGDVVQLADASGQLLWTYDYDAFGNEIPQTEANAGLSEPVNAFRYAGEYWDAETGTYYLRARYYDPAVGRFTTEDTVSGVSSKLANGQEIVDPLSLNLYTYCHNNPLMYRDSSGHFPVETALDVASIAWSAADFFSKPTWFNAAMLLWDVAATAIPYVPGSYVLDGVSAVAKVAGKADDAVDAARVIGNSADNVIDAVRPSTSVAKAASSRVLRKNMVGAGISVPKFKNAAHHIVAGKAPGAKEARQILQKFGIDINDAINGVFLPTVKGGSSAAYHPGLHKETYYKKVELMLKDATNRADAEKILNKIAKQLQDGTFMK